MLRLLLLDEFQLLLFLVSIRVDIIFEIGIVEGAASKIFIQAPIVHFRVWFIEQAQYGRLFIILLLEVCFEIIAWVREQVCPATQVVVWGRARAVQESTGIVFNCELFTILN